MRAGKLARWVGRLASVAVFGAAAVLGGVVWAHADDEPAQPDPAKWESEDPSGDDLAGAEDEGSGDEDSGDEDSEGAKWESEGPGAHYSPFGAKWE